MAIIPVKTKAPPLQVGASAPPPVAPPMPLPELTPPPPKANPTTGLISTGAKVVKPAKQVGTSGGGAEYGYQTAVTPPAPPTASAPASVTTAKAVADAYKTPASNPAAGPSYQSIVDGAIKSATSSAPQTAAVPKAKTATAGTVKATTMNVAPGQTVEGIISRLTKDNSTPYMQRARAIAMEGMNDRGLLSSSLAQGAGSQAAIDAAYKIAATDAGIYANQQLANMGALNQVAVGNADRTFDASKFNAGAENTFGLEKFRADTNRDQSVLDASLDASLIGVKTAAEKDIMGYGSDIDLNKMAFDLSGDLTKLDLDQQNYLKRLTAGLDIDLTKMSKGQEYDLAKLAAQNGYDVGQMRQALENDVTLAKVRSSLDESMQMKLATFESSIGDSRVAKNHLVQTTSKYADLANIVRTDPNLDAETKAQVLADLQADWVEEGTRIATIYNIELPDDYFPAAGV